MKVGSLFSGCGGLDLGFELAGFETKWFCEIDKWCNKILTKNWPETLIHGDVHELGTAEPVDILIGGFPCQPVSQAGQKKAEEDPRWLWPGFLDAISSLRPSIVVVENVPGLRKRGFDRVLGDLAEGGYNAQWFSLRSSDIGAPHRRERVFVIANSIVGRKHETNEGDQFLQFSGAEDIAFADSDQKLLYRQLEEGSRRGTELAISPASHSSGTGTGRNGGGSSGEEEQIGWSKEGYPNTPQFSDEDASNSTSEGSQGTQSEERRYLSTGSIATDRYSYRQQSEWQQDTEWEDERGNNSNGLIGQRQEWGKYEGAIRRWESIFEIAPDPRTDEGRLSPNFVEWMMGFPQNWTEGVSRSQRLKMLGNSVQVQCAYQVANIVKSLAEFS